MDENEIGRIVVDQAVKLHMATGPGLLESVYEVILASQLEKRGLAVSRQVPIPVEFDGEFFEIGFRADIIIEGKVILELKSVEMALPLHKKQLLTYLKLTNLKLGYLINFGSPIMKEGITRLINGKL